MFTVIDQLTSRTLYLPILSPSFHSQSLQTKYGRPSVTMCYVGSALTQTWRRRASAMLPLEISCSLFSGRLEGLKLVK